MLHSGRARVGRGRGGCSRAYGRGGAAFGRAAGARVSAGTQPRGHPLAARARPEAAGPRRPPAAGLKGREAVRAPGSRASGRGAARAPFGRASAGPGGLCGPTPGLNPIFMILYFYLIR